MGWVLFSVGAENLAKTACVCNGVKVSTRATLGTYTNAGYFRELCKKTGLSGDPERTLEKGYKRLKEVRNRDAHSYHKNVRSADFPLVKQSFVPAFNVLVEAVRRGGHPLL